MRGLMCALAVVLSSCLAFTQRDTPWPCASDADCSNGDVCQFSHGSQICAPPGYCQTQNDCASRLTCTNNVCTAPSCTSNADCSPFACVKSACVVQCMTDADCSMGFACAAGGDCVIPPCTSDAKCGGYRCVDGACGTTCGSDADCSSGNACNTAGQCAPRTCTNGVAGQCGGFACSGGRCPTSCTDSSACDPGLTCSGGVCACTANPAACGAYACSNGACLTQCASDSDCAPMYGCASGKCMTCAGTAVSCAQQASCGVPGCSSTCTGGSINCSQMDYAQQACQDVVGCTFDSYTMFCTGTASCSDQSATLCQVLPGCSVGFTCTGTVTPCSQLTVAQCAGTAGCSLH